MSIKNRIILITFLANFAFWIPIWLVFAETRNIPLHDSYILISIYSLLVVLLEYPTGVIGDTISHKLSTGLGYLFTSLGYLVMLFISSFNGMLIALVLVAMGTTFISGSDQAYFFNILPNFEKEYPNIKTSLMLASLIGTISGAFLFEFNTNLPVFLNVISIALAIPILISLPKEERKGNTLNGNPFVIAKKALVKIKSNSSLLTLLIISAIIYAFSSNLKWLYGNIFDVIHIDTVWWGILIAAFYSARFFGIKISSKKSIHISTTILLLALANFVFLMGFIINPLFIIGTIVASMIIIGLIETELEVSIIKQASDDTRASTLSVKGLMGRLGGAFYIYLAGNLTSNDSLYKITTLTFAILLFGVGLNIYQQTKKRNL